jgi:uncharacterized protein (TIGR00297 family)
VGPHGVFPPGLRPALAVVALSALGYWLIGAPNPGIDQLSETPRRIPGAIAANVVFAFAGWWVRSVTIPGALTGAAIGTIIAAGSGWGSWWLLVLMFGTVVAATRVGSAGKRAARIDEPREGRRGAGNAVANAGLAAGAAAVFAATGSEMAQLAVLASLITSGSDTVSSEIGKAWGHPTWHLLQWRSVPAGTSGGVSVAGTLAGALAATALAAAAVRMGMIAPLAAACVVPGAVLAGLVEGVVARPLEARGWDNDDLNVLNSAAGVVLTCLGQAVIT